MDSKERAVRLHGYLESTSGSRDAWIENTIKFCKELAEEREEQKSNQAFGDWFHEQGFKWNRKPMNEKMREAAIKIGKKLPGDEKRVRLVIESSSSIDLLFLARKIVPGKKVGTKNKNNSKLTLKEKIDAAVQIATAQMKKEHAEEIRRLEIDHDMNFQEHFKRRMEELTIPALNERIKEINLNLKNREGVFDQDEYNLLLRCLHPDVVSRLNDEELQGRFNKAFRLLHEKRILLLPERYHPTKTLEPLPKTWEEFYEYGKRMKAEQAA